MARDVNRELLELAAFEGEELEAFLPRWLETAERCKLDDEKIAYALDVYLPQNWDLKYLGVRKMLGAYLRELADIVHTPEMKENGVKILYGILPAIANYYYAAKIAGGDKIFIGFPDLLMVNTLNSFFHAASPFLNVAEEYGFTYGWLPSLPAEQDASGRLCHRHHRRPRPHLELGLQLRRRPQDRRDDPGHHRQEVEVSRLPCAA